jgi:hypothetical protein
MHACKSLNSLEVPYIIFANSRGIHTDGVSFLART